MEPFKIGDEVKVQNGIALDVEGEVTNGWAGTIKDIRPGGEYIQVELDTTTLQSLSDSYLIYCSEIWAAPDLYTFEVGELTKTSRRDTEEERAAALAAIEERMDEFEPDEYDESQHEEWVKKFIDSRYFQQLTEAQKHDARFATQSFLDYLFNFTGLAPEEWDKSAVEECCLDFLPRKISAGIEFFENLGPILLQFFPFLEEEGTISNAKELCAKVESIKQKIPRVASNPVNWGMAKSFMMGALDEGVDPGDEEAMDAYLKRMQLSSLQALEAESRATDFSQRLVERTPFDKLNRNDRITVKYEDGTVKSNVKFKLVKQDLLDGKCEWIQ